MLKYDSEKMHLQFAGTGGEILADLAACTMRALYNICGKDENAVKAMLPGYVASLLAAGNDNNAWELLRAEECSSTTIDLSHLMNKRGESGE